VQINEDRENVLENVVEVAVVVTVAQYTKNLGSLLGVVMEESISSSSSVEDLEDELLEIFL
jgi:hypothetical protein